jgi:hypothetical protein
VLLYLCIVGDCDKIHIQHSLTDIGWMECVYVNVNVNTNAVCIKCVGYNIQALYCSYV